MQLNLHRGSSKFNPWGFHGLPIHAASFDGWHFKWLKPFAYVDKAGQIHHIPAHDGSDGASTPRLIWGIIPPFGRHWPPAGAHDHWYRHTKLPKAKCDALFLEAMEANGVSWLWRHVIWLGVVIGGGAAFRKDRAGKVR